jgi:hypothetical protein
VNITIDGTFVHRGADSSQAEIDPEGENPRLEPILRLRKTRARSGTAFKDGRLALEFDDGSSIHVPADPCYEP